MTENIILDELHEARRKILADWKGDTESYLRDAQQRLEASGRPIWKGIQRSKHCNAVAGQPRPDGGSTAVTR